MTEITDHSDFGEARQLYQSLFCSGKTLHHIYRIQNSTLYLQYMAEKRKLEQGAEPYMCNELYLYHGTSAHSVAGINENGFDSSYAGAHATMYGHGSYFARDLKYSTSDDYSPVDPTNGHQFVYAARVLVGHFCQGAPDMQHLPLQKNGQTYDSAVDNLAEPYLFVIFRDTSSYPVYLYEFS